MKSYFEIKISKKCNGNFLKSYRYVEVPWHAMLNFEAIVEYYNPIRMFFFIWTLKTMCRFTGKNSSLLGSFATALKLSLHAIPYWKGMA